MTPASRPVARTSCPATSPPSTFRGANTTVTLDCGGIALEAHVANVHGEPPLWLRAGFPVEARVSPSALRLLVS